MRLMDVLMAKGVTLTGKGQSALAVQPRESLHSRTVE